MKCPICGKDLVEIELGECWFLACCNSKCRCKDVASDTVWKFLTVAIKNRKALSQELIRTRKALDVAVDALKNVFDYAKIVSSELQKNHSSQFQTPINKMQYSAQQALKQITALEQKDK